MAGGFPEMIHHVCFSWIRKREALRLTAVVILWMTLCIRLYFLIVRDMPNVFREVFVLNPDYSEYHTSVTTFFLIATRLDEMFNLCLILIADFWAFWSAPFFWLAILLIPATVWFFITSPNNSNNNNARVWRKRTLDWE